MMKKQNWKRYSLSVLLIGATLAWSGCEDSYPGAPAKSAPQGKEAVVALPVSKSNDMKVFVHFMPWFETADSHDGTWGYHWTMKTCNPAVVDASGKRQIASHYYPLTGPYASGDEAVLDYQCLLMKYSGVDGVMVDWYGANSDNAVARHKSNTEALARAVAKACLKMAVVYEDYPLADASDRVGQARMDMRYLAETFFKKDFYVKVDGRPLLLVFGPQQLLTGKEWYRTFAILKDKPVLLCLNGHSGRANSDGYTNSEGEYLWVNPAPDYSVAKNFKMYVGGAMPGFYDFYKEGGAGEGYTTYDSENGALFKRQLDAAKSADLKWLQVSTWNDYGEGTNIEPTQEYGYRYLVDLQQFTGVSYRQQDLELIYRWYRMRVAHPDDTRVKEAYKALVTLQPDKARELLGDGE